MGQVPGKTYGIVGSGRMARHLSHYLNLLKIEIKTWNRESPDTPESALLNCDTILILISDDAIEDFLKLHPSLSKKQVVHFSGSLSLKGVPSTHPIFTFSDETYDLETYIQIPFVFEEGKASFDEVFPALPNASYSINPELKPLYHSLCVMGGNFTNMLWTKVFQQFERKLKIPREATYPYLRQTVKNLTVHAESSLTGPLVRKDNKTIQSNLDALKDDPFHQVYEAFVDAYATQSGDKQ